MHKIIKEYVQTNKTLSEILQELPNDEQPVEVAFRLILKKLANSAENLTAEDYGQIDEAIENGHPDDELFLFFLSYLILIYSHKRMFVKSESVYRISFSFSISKYHPVVQAFYYYTVCFYFFAIDDYAKTDEMQKMALAKIPKNSLRYPNLFSRISQLLGILGKLYDLPKEDLALLEKLSETEYAALGALADNALFVGDTQLINKYDSELRQRYKTHDPILEDVGKSMIELYQGNFEEKKNVTNDFKVCVPYYKSLKNRNLDVAKETFKKIDDTSLCSIFIFVNYHHSFVTGRFKLIENLIKAKANQTNHDNHYMLDFFIARYFLIKNKKDLARYYYTQLLKNCEKHHAINRLKFEMQFAFELTPDSFFELTQPLEMTFSDENSKTLAVALMSLDHATFGLNRIVGKSKGITAIKKQVKQFANIQRPILIIGETGAGKEVVARAIHEESVSNKEPFLAINCGALTDTLLQSELFGYEIGAFTGAVTAHKGIFEAADNGVVFLDEFGEMSPKLQVSLLRVLENNEIRRIGGTKARAIKCRIIAATNANIEELISKKLFREDLYHRLKQFTISIPPLRNRKEDIPQLIDFFLTEQNADQKQVLSNELMALFQEYQWPGNIRELKNEIDRIKILCGYKPIIEKADIDFDWMKKNPTKIENSETLALNTSKEEKMHQRLLDRKVSAGDKRRQQIIKLFQQYKQLTRSQISDALEICSLTATKDLQQLCKEGQIIKVKPTLSPRSHYFQIV
jgi:transcriptional regulator with PAS, ATPase and Fis domain